MLPCLTHKLNVAPASGTSALMICFCIENSFACSRYWNRAPRGPCDTDETAGTIRLTREVGVSHRCYDAPTCLLGKALQVGGLRALARHQGNPIVVEVR